MANDEAIMFVCRYAHDMCIFSANMTQLHQDKMIW